MSDEKQTTLLERYQSLVTISRDLASTLELSTLLNRIGHAAADLCNAQAASILLYDERKKQLHFEAATNLEEPLMRGLIVPVEGSIAGWIVQNRQPIIIPDTQQDPRHFGKIAKDTKVTTTSMLGVPLIAKDKIIGVLEAINKFTGEFNEEDQDVLMALGAQAAVAIENARLFLQSDLIAEMVHELRTPLSSLNTAAHLLSRPDLPDDQRRDAIEAIESETVRLNEMTTAFLDVARLESGRTQFTTELFDPGLLLEDCVSVVRSKVNENNLQLHLNIPVDLPKLKADQDKIKQVVLNLLSNAIKYNRPNGSITVSAEVKRDYLTIAVSDTGLGIKEDDLTHLFKKFFRVQSSEETVPGSGLGLAINKGIVDAHGGYIEVQSEIGVGTTVSVYLPLAAERQE